MTSQKQPVERQREIIEAALEVLSKRGLSGFSMEAVIELTPLSKGGVYRFYANKNELLSAVFTTIVETLMPVDPAVARSWNLPLRETLLRLVFSPFFRDDGLELQRIHVRLMPELPHDQALLRSAQAIFDPVLHKYYDVIMAIVERDGLKTKPGFEALLVSVLGIGQSLFDGLILNNLGGMPLEEAERRMQTFIDLVMRAILEE